MAKFSFFIIFILFDRLLAPFGHRILILFGYILKDNICLINLRYYKQFILASRFLKQYKPT